MSTTSKKPVTKNPSAAPAAKRKRTAPKTDLDQAAIQTARGEAFLDQGMQEVAEVETAVQVSAMGYAAAASDATRAVDAAVAADRLSRLGSAMAEAGVEDISQGEEMLLVSEDVSLMSAMVGLMSARDMEHGLELARVAGEIWTVSEVVNVLQMPVLTGFLENRSQLLKEMAVEQILRSARRSSLSEAMAATSERAAALGENEVAEGITRIVVADEVAGRADALDAASLDLAARSAVEEELSKATAQAAREMAVEGLADIVVGSAEMGEAAAKSK